MLPNIEHIPFNNKTVPKASFEIALLEDLFARGLDAHPELETLHQVGFYILLFVTENTGLHTIDFTQYSYKKGNVITIRKDQIHKFHLTKAKGFLLFFTNDFILSYLEQQEALKTFQLFNELLGSPKISLSSDFHMEILELVQQIKKEYSNAIDSYSLGIIRSLLHIIITKLYRVKSLETKNIISKKYLSEFISFQKLVEEHCFSTKKVMDYAQKMGVTTKTLNNIVQDIVHKSAKVFIDDMVITKIKRLLTHAPLSIKEIAYTAGFDEPTNFYKYFKKHTKISPEAFRKTYL
jgi:AraC-like DNA-binding protein